MVHWLVQSSFKSWRVPPFPSVIPIWGLGEEENVWDFSDSECAWTGSTDKCSAVSKDLVFLVSFSFSVSLLALYLATTDTTEASVVRSQQLIEYAHACLCGVTFWIVSICVWFEYTSVCVCGFCPFCRVCVCVPASSATVFGFSFDLATSIAVPVARPTFPLFPFAWSGHRGRGMGRMAHL